MVRGAGRGGGGGTGRGGRGGGQLGGVAAVLGGTGDHVLGALRPGTRLVRRSVLQAGTTTHRLFLFLVASTTPTPTTIHACNLTTTMHVYVM